jgi:DNA-binding CsgD family transcriptional regulator
MQIVAGHPEQSGHWAERWLELEGRARIVVARSRRVLWRSDAVSRVIDRSGPVALDGDRLAGADGAAHRALIDCLSAAASDGTASVTIAGGDARNYVVEAHALAAGPDAPIGLTIRDETPSGLSDLAAAAGLTHTEARVVAMLLNGLNPTEIAEDTGTSILTVRTHIKRVYSKLDIHSKEQLFARLNRY